MAIYYVNKSGSVANNGTTPTLAKLLIQDGVTLCATSGDTLIVGSGSYNERVNVTNKAISLLADGIVVIDGNGLAGTGSGLLIYISNITGKFILGSVQSGGKWIIKNQNTGSDAIGAIYANIPLGGAWGGSIYISNCELYGNINNRTGIMANLIFGNVQGVSSIFSILNCVLSNFTAYGINETNTSSAFVTVNNNNTFYNCGIGIYASNFTTPTIGNNIFHTCTTSVRTQTAPTTLLNYNIHYLYTNILTVNVTNYTTLSAVQTLGSELNGTVGNPGLIDPANGVFFLSSLGNYGAYPYSAITRGANYNPDSKWIITAAKDDTGWYCAGGLISKNGTDGAFELTSGTVDTIESPVFDCGSSLSQTLISLASDQTFPTNMADTTKTDIRPNKQSVEIRTSDSSFVQADASPSWVEQYIETPLAGVTGRYLQLRITLRSDDVAG